MKVTVPLRIFAVVALTYRVAVTAGMQSLAPNGVAYVILWRDFVEITKL